MLFDALEPLGLDRGALERPAIIAPAPRQVSWGRVYGTVGRGTTRVSVKVDGVVRQTKKVTGTRFAFTLELPRRDVTIRVVAIDAFGRRTTSSVAPVYGLPRAGRPSGFRASVEDAILARRIRELTRAFPGTAAVFVQDLRTRRGAAWNARARFPAASTLKLAIAVEVLRRLRGPPAAGSTLDRLLWRMIVYSDNEAANSLLEWRGGSTSGGAAIVNRTMGALGIDESIMYGGYALVAAAARRIPLTVESQPSFGVGKHTTAHDLAMLHRLVHMAAGGLGALPRLEGSFTRADGRFLLWLLAHVTDTGKLDRYLPGTVPVLHKAGWISEGRHDSGLVYWANGSYVAVVMTWDSAGVATSADVLAGRVAAAGLRRFRELGEEEPSRFSTETSSASA